MLFRDRRDDWRPNLTKTNSTKARMGVAFAAALAIGVATPALVNAAIFNTPPANIGGQVRSDEQAPILIAQAADAAQLMVRIQQLEEQNRQLNGQIEGLTFQLTQLQELVNRMQEDTDFRLQALEGGAGPKPDAATQPAGATPAEALPQDPNAVPVDANGVPLTVIPEQGVQPLPGEAEFDPTFDEGAAAPMDDLGNSADPLVGTGASGGVDLATGQPIDLSYDPAAANTGNPDADAQFAAGYEALKSGDYAFAEDQFSQFLSLYPDNAQAPDAASFLGDALMQRAAYNEAADVLLKAYQAAPSSPRAPDLLVKLGASMAGVGEREVACRTFAQVEATYTSLTPELAARLAAEKTGAECPPA
jgi:tol-pal system protein YbgF